MMFCLVSFPPLPFPLLLQVEGGQTRRVGQGCALLGWESEALPEHPASSSRILYWESRRVLDGYH